jgi:hypothetical protein
MAINITPLHTKHKASATSGTIQKHRLCLVFEKHKFYLKVLVKRFIFWVFLVGIGWNVNFDKIFIFCCLNCLSECINGFSVLKSPWDTRIIQT